MTSNLLFDFSVDRENKNIHVKREFAAELPRVWKAWTDSEVLDQWWAPKPYQAKTKSMNFSIGGVWLYAMISPQGEKQWCKADYKSIDELKNFSAVDAFCDENGVVNAEFPRSFWKNEFDGKSDSTLVSITITYNEVSDLDKIIAMGFKEGFSMGLANLDELLKTSSK